MQDLIFDLIHSVNKMKDKLVDLAAKIDFLSKSPAYSLSKKYITEEEACRILRCCARVLAQMRANNEEACRILKCCPKVLAHMRHNNEIPYYRIKKRILYQASDLHEYIEKHYIH